MSYSLVSAARVVCSYDGGVCFPFFKCFDTITRHDTPLFLVTTNDPALWGFEMDAWLCQLPDGSLAVSSSM